MSTRAVAWQGIEEWLAEHVRLELSDDGVLADGVQLGVEPEPYRADYRLEVPGAWVTRRLEVEVSGADGRRGRVLEHDGAGAWTLDGAPAPALDGALDCDLAFSPLTNLMPVRRHALHAPGAAARDFAMAWVDLPSLAVHRSPQRYEPLAPGRVRFVSLDSDFTAELELDADGLVLRYPRLAERVTAPRPG